MCHNRETHLQDEHRQIIRGPSMPSLSPSLSILLKFCNLEQRPQTKNYSEQKKYHSHQLNLHHRQKHKERHFFPHCGFIFLILLSVIKDSLATTYSPLAGVTTMAPQTNFVPYFDFDVPRNITVTVGQTGFLHCRVERLGDKDVSWIRKRDLHILTAGATTYTSDQRFQVLHPEGSGNWTLQIKYPQLRDSGIYECQINTEPKMSLSYTFNVVELKATIIGPADLYVKSGSDINLTCKIMQGPHELGNIFWYKGPEIIDMATNENEIESGTRISVENDWLDGLSSRLKIRRASSSDTGNYTCVPTIAKSSSVYVHVIIGEHPAAMQHNSSATHCGNFYISLCCVMFIALTCCLQHLMCSNTYKGSCAVSLPSKAAPRSSSSSATTFEYSPLSASTTASTSMSKSKSMIDTSFTLVKSSSSENCTLSAAPHTRASAFSSLTHLHSSATAANTDCEKTRLFVSNGRIIR